MTTSAERQAALPRVVSAQAWQQARAELLVKEKELTRALDALAAERRRLPMVPFDKEYLFDGPGGSARLLELFEHRRQLIVYHFMWPGDHYCVGCSGFTDNIGHLAHLNARDTSMALVSAGPLAEIEPFKKRMGWTLPWYSSQHSDFNTDCGVTAGFGLSVFLRDGDRVYRTYFTTARGVDRLRADLNLLDLTPLGRQEDWEDSPVGWQQTPPYQWWRLHDEYGELPPRNAEN
ncbi:DUF899 domain-containing protein [Actinomadura sp. HBU206391]|uniref:DUF899 domain-containing protein n=1 Tax=Actinomadura sp. HBU206391 TaxID=2731692 RepID=UPI00164F1426|nr:DUF899 domain-containing protein [Actinomadura sp. HBU206391]MBC6461678.1 DUF899 domain-containing protein [Actinomadura sp. HBU206391]